MITFDPFSKFSGAFLIPYLLLLFLVGRPIYYLELIVGQFSGRGPIKMWKCVPALKGVGFAQLISVSYVAIFYNYLMGVSLFYFFASFASKLPWTVCNENWIPAEFSGYCTENSTTTNFQNQTWAELYYKREVLNESRGLWDVNSVSWKLVLCLLGAWTLVYLSIVKGVTSLGKVSGWLGGFGQEVSNLIFLFTGGLLHRHLPLRGAGGAAGRLVVSGGRPRGHRLLLYAPV